MVDCPGWTPSSRLDSDVPARGGRCPRRSSSRTKTTRSSPNRWAEALDVPRVLHADDITSGTRDVEHALEGNGPWTARARRRRRPRSRGGGRPRARAVERGPRTSPPHTPGHTAGCVSVFCAPLRALFTGDHVCGRGKGWTEDGDSRPSRLTAMPRYCWGNWSEQRRSVEKLVGLEFDADIRDTDDP